jgi:hypothetical protein
MIRKGTVRRGSFGRDVAYARPNVSLTEHYLEPRIEHSTAD